MNKKTNFKEKKGRSKKKTEKNKRVVKPRCNCMTTTDKSALKCSEISEEERKTIFKKFWDMTWGEKKVFVNGLTQDIPTKRPRDRPICYKEKKHNYIQLAIEWRTSYESLQNDVSKHYVLPK